MSHQFQTDLGLTLTLPEGSEPVPESSAGPNSRQFSLANGDVVSLIRDDATAATLAGVIAWTQGMAAHYVQNYGAVEEMQGSINSPGKEAYAYAVSFKDADGVPRRATLIGVLAEGTFAGATLLSINAGQPLDATLVQGIVDGIVPTR